MLYRAKQGDIVWVTLEENQESQKKQGRRPALVVSNNTFNGFVKTAAMVCPITNSDQGLPIQIKLDDRTSTAGVVLCDQAKLVDILESAAEWIEKAPEDIVLEVVDAICSFIEVEP